MAAISHAFSLPRVAQILGREERLLRELADQLEPEDGVIWILDSNEREILAFTPRGIEALREIIDDQIDKTG
jgi:hypothetical protein